jgi:hypothetical protein
MLLYRQSRSIAARPILSKQLDAVTPLTSIYVSATRTMRTFDLVSMISPVGVWAGHLEPPSRADARLMPEVVSGGAASAEKGAFWRRRPPTRTRDAIARLIPDRLPIQ